MDPLDTMVLLSLVKPSGDRWPLEAAIVTRLAQLRGGGFCWARQAAEWTGADEVACRRALLSLERRRIVARDAGESGRDHIRWCSVSEDWRRWRVEWLLDASQVAAQLAFAAQQRDQSPLTRIFARSYSARSVARIARSHDARSWEEDMAEVAGIARHRSARSSDDTKSDRALLIARSLGRRRAPLERAILGSDPQQLSHGADGDETAPPRGEPTPSSQERISSDVQRIAARVCARAIAAPGYGRKFLNGPPLVALADLVDEHGAEVVGKLLEQVPAGELSPLQVVEQLTYLTLHPTEALAEPAPVDIGARVSHLRRMVATYEQNGGAPPQDLLEDLARWQTELDAPQEVHA